MRQGDHCPAPSLSHDLDDVGQSLEQVLELGVTVVCDTALTTKVVVVRWDKLVERHFAARGCFKQVNQLPGEQRQLTSQGCAWLWLWH